MKLSYKNLFVGFYMAVLCILTVCSDFLTLTFPGIYQYSIILFGIISVIFLGIGNCLRIKADFLILLIIGMAAIIFLRNEEPYTYLIYFLILFAVLVSRSIDIRYFEKLITVLLWCYIFFAVATIFLYFNRDIYMTYVVPLFPQYSSEMAYCYNVGYMTGLTANYARNSSMLSIGIIIILGKLYNKKSKKLLCYILTAILIIALILSCKRAHTLFILITLLFLLFLHMADKPKSRIFKFVGIGIVMLVALSIMVDNIPQFANLANRFTNLMEDEAVQNRFAIWELALSVFSDHILFGVGWGNFMSYTEQFLGTSWTAHNMYLQFLCETGIVGTLIFMTFIIFVYYQSIKIFVRLRSGKVSIPGNAQQNMFFSVGIQTFVLLYSFTGSPLTDVKLYIPYYIGCIFTIIYYSYLKYQALNSRTLHRG